MNNTALNNTPPDSEEEIEGTKTNTSPRASTPIDRDTEVAKLPKKITIQDIPYHPGALCIPTTNIIATLVLQSPAYNYLTCTASRLQNMVQPVPAGLQGADPAIVEILSRMENKDNRRKKFLMFSKNAFDGK